ncbi:MAG: hypothetical protein RIG82_08635 [Phycisphaeraceae bacterium]
MSILSLKTGQWWKLPVLLFIVLPLVLLLTWHVGLKIRTAWILSEIRDTGLPTTVAELDAYLDEPGKMNAVEIFLEVFELVESDSDLEALLPGYGRDVEEPDYGVHWPEELSEARRDLLLLNREALARSSEAVGLTFARYPINMDEGIEVLLPYLGQVRSF